MRATAGKGSDMALTRALNRRVLLGALLAAPIVVWGVWLRAGGEGNESAGTTNQGGTKVTIIKFTDSGERVGPVTVDKVVKSDSEWKKQLNPEQFQVTRHAGTEPPFTGIYAESH